MQAPVQQLMGIMSAERASILTQPTGRAVMLLTAAGTLMDTVMTAVTAQHGSPITSVVTVKPLLTVQAQRLLGGHKCSTDIIKRTWRDKHTDQAPACPEIKKGAR